jgi:hypothetical protein
MTKHKSRLGNADSIFKVTKAEKETAARVIDAVIRPVAGTSLENRLSVILPPEQVDFLDGACLAIKRNTRKKIKRTEIIRALIGGLMGSGMDLTSFGTAEEIAAAIQDRLKG